MGDMIDLVLVQADAFHEIDLNLIARRKAASERGAIETAMLGDRQDWRDVVAGVRVIGSQKGVVKIQFAHRDAIGPGRPFRRDPLRLRQTKYGGPRLEGMCKRLRPRAGYGTPCDRSRRHGGVVNDAVADHLDHGWLDSDRIGRHFGDLPGKLIRARQVLGGFMRSDGVRFHDLNSL
jgi:hypothetical protein